MRSMLRHTILQREGNSIMTPIGNVGKFASRAVHAGNVQPAACTRAPSRAFAATLGMGLGRKGPANIIS